MSYLLQPGEKIVCWAKPSPWAYAFWPVSVLVWCICVYGLLFLTLIVEQPTVAGLGIVAVGMVAVAWLVLTPIAIFLIWQWSNADRTLYVLTSERLIWLRPRWNGKYEFIETWPEDLQPGFVACYGDPLRPVRRLCRHQGIQYLTEQTLQPKLIGRLKHPDNDVRRRAVLALVKYADNGQIPVAVLVEALDSEDSFIRAQAAIALGKMRSQALPATIPLRLATFDENQAVSQAALRALNEIRNAA